MENNENQPPKFYAPVAVTTGNIINTIIAKVDRVRVGMEIEKIDEKTYLDTLESANKELFEMLSKEGITELERNFIKSFLVQYHALIEEKKSKKVPWLRVGFGLLTIASGMFLGGVV